MKRLCLAAMMMAMSASMTMAECQPSYNATVGTRSDGVIANAKAGQPCFVSAYLNFPTMRAGGTTLQAIDIIRPPKKGQLHTEGASFTYTPNAKFDGKDSFFVRFRFQSSSGKPARAGVRFAVTG